MKKKKPGHVMGASPTATIKSQTAGATGRAITGNSTIVTKKPVRFMISAKTPSTTKQKTMM